MSIFLGIFLKGNNFRQAKPRFWIWRAVRALASFPRVQTGVRGRFYEFSDFLVAVFASVLLIELLAIARGVPIIRLGPYLVQPPSFLLARHINPLHLLFLADPRYGIDPVLHLDPKLHHFVRG